MKAKSEIEQCETKANPTIKSLTWITLNFRVQERPGAASRSEDFYSYHGEINATTRRRRVGDRQTEQGRRSQTLMPHSVRL